MKTILMVSGLALLSQSLSAATNDLTTTLQKGLFEEEANHNLGAAIQLYQSVISQFDKDRKLAATAVFRLAECYRKQGNTNEANAQYDRVLREFADQTQFAALSRQNMAALGGTPSTSTAASWRAARQEQKRFLEEEIKLVENKLAADQKRVESGVTSREDLWTTQRELLQLKRQMAALDEGGPLLSAGGNPRDTGEAASLKAQLDRLESLGPAESRIAVQQEFPNQILTSLMQKLVDAQQTLAALNTSLGPSTTEVVQERARIETMNQQIDIQVQAALNALRAKQQAASDRAALLAQNGNAAAANAESASNTEPASTASEAEEVKRIQALIKDSPDLINAREQGGYGGTPLHKAAMEGQVIVAQFLLANGADVDAKDNSRRGTPLHYAAEYGHKSMVELLLNHKARVDAADKENWTPLHLAAQKGFSSIVDVLLAHGANVNARGGWEDTPLHLAVVNGFRSVVELLLSKGADVNAIATSVPDPANGTSSGTPLHLAANRGDLLMTELLLTNKANPNLTDSAGKTPLDLAAAKGNVAVAEALLGHGAEVNASNADIGQKGWTALHYAVIANQKEMVNLLLKNKADPNVEIETGFSVNKPGQPTLATRGSLGSSGSAAAGYTPLLLAVTKGYADLVDPLLEAKADPNLKSKSGDVALLNAMLFTPPAVRHRILKSLLEHGANPDPRDDNDETPLMHAADQRDKESVELLLSHKADVNARTTRWGVSALHFLVFSRNASTPLPANYIGPIQDVPAIAELLLNAGADPNAQTQDGKTPLSYLKEGPPSPELTGVLRKHGAIEEIPRLDAIEFRRGSAHFPVVSKGTNDSNHFTLFEMLAIHYGFVSAEPHRRPDDRPDSWPMFDSASHTLRNSLKFPDLAHVTIWHHDRTAQPINLEGIFGSVSVSGKCQDDIPLNWGDTVEIPENDHPISAVWQGLPKKDLSVLQECLTRHVEITVKGESTNMVLAPQFTQKKMTITSDGRYTADVPQFTLVSVLYRSGMLRASSDLSRVKVIRRDPRSGQSYELVFNCKGDVPGGLPDLWLRDGDYIEVPERQ
jgi:ankyrin repeat protein